VAVRLQEMYVWRRASKTHGFFGKHSNF